MVNRVYVEKKEGLRHEARGLRYDIRHILLIKNLRDVRLFNRYDVEGLDEKTFSDAVRLVLSEPQLDRVTTELPQDDAVTIAVEYLPGQFDQRADSAAQCIQILTQGERPLVRTAKVYRLYGSLTEQEIQQIRKYVINPVEAREASLEKPETLDMRYQIPGEVEMLTGFCQKTEGALETLLQEMGLAMDLDDLRFCQQYFQSEHRNPTITEIRMIDTYWSDHCRHTTFLTTIDSVSFQEEELRQAWERYQETRRELGRTKPVNLMDIATLAARELKKQGKLEKLDESEEINACTVKITVNADGEDEDWLLLFKNETHNHPTEIEPFGGAATCIGGAIRDPLSGRSYVYQAMRVTGAADPTGPVQETMEHKLPQRKLVTTAANGYSSYGNQIGLATGLVDEIYHPGYAAKRMEIGAVIGAAPAKNVRREVPVPGDVIILLGGRTGRDGVGGATGSSKAHNADSLETCGAEVQKGNAPEERKLQRLFRNEEASRLIKRCNDFGAGGVSVAIGELADGLDIDLNRVPRKYEGLDGTELAISESQERMAVVVAPEDQARFMELAAAENLEATHVADVTDTNRLIMHWNGKTILNLSREFLNSNGAEKHINIRSGESGSIHRRVSGGFTENMEALSRDLNVVSRRGLSERFDSTIGAGTVLMPFGGKYQRTPIQAMAAKISCEKKHTDLASVMAYGYNPFIMEKNRYRGAYLAVVESVCKLVAAGAAFREVYLTFQEYFGKPGQTPERWAEPLEALLGAFQAQLDLGIAAIGGKDSMSGSYEKLDVPPTLVSFAVTTENAASIISPEYKAAGHRVLWLRPAQEKELPTRESLFALFERVHAWISSGQVVSAYTPTYGGLAEAVLKQCMGNGFGFSFAPSLSVEDLFGYQYGSFLLELESSAGDNSLLDAIYGDEVLKAAGVTVADLGTVTELPELRYNAEALALSALEENYENRLEKVFSCNMRLLGEETAPEEEEKAAGTETGVSGNAFENVTENVTGKSSSEEKADSLVLPDSEADMWIAPELSVEKPRVLIPVFPGSNCEYDSARACRDAGLEPEIVVIRNRTQQDIIESVQHVAKRIGESQIIFLPGGFSGGDEPDGSAKFITSFFRNEAVKNATMDLLKNRMGLMLGICNGFQALIKLGLVPYGEILDTDESCPTLTYNTIGRHQSKIVQVRVASNESPWLANSEPGDIYSVPVSHGEGRFLCEEELFWKMVENGQIATQYVDLQGRPTMDIQYNPNGSYFAVEGISSPDGRILGKMGHAERLDTQLYKNVPGNYDMGLFRNAKEYFE